MVIDKNLRESYAHCVNMVGQMPVGDEHSLKKRTIALSVERTASEVGGDGRERTS